MPALHLGLREARALHLAAQGLLGPPRRKASRAGLLAAIERMGVLQIDTIHVVARSPYLVLFSRLGPYPQPWLDEALASGAIFECWAHEACFAPIADWPLHRRVSEGRSHWAMDRARRVLRRDGPAMRRLLAGVEAGGPVRAADFEAAPRGSSGWWRWKKEKRWLEAWLALGELMVARRERFQRVYDVRRRVHPASEGLPLPDPAEARRLLAGRAVRALGVTQARWIHDYFRTRPRLGDRDLAPLLDDGTVAEVKVEGWKAPGYVHRDHLPVARRIAAGRVAATRTALLSPFDPVVWDRERALALFGFAYRLECYLPAARRRHGYFALPVLRRGALVGRLDAKAHRAEGIFEVRSLHLERGVRPDGALLADLAGAIAACAAWHETPAVRVGATSPRPVGRALAALLASGAR